MGYFACRSERFSGLIKGHGEVLVESGRADAAALTRHHIGRDDLEEELRLNGVESQERVKLARLERSGDISVIKEQ
jgi:uncharacterized membrane protein YcaP (DUF421 family)